MVNCFYDRSIKTYRIGATGTGEEPYCRLAGTEAVRQDNSGQPMAHAGVAQLLRFGGPHQSDFHDTGPLHYLLGVRTEKDLLTHPKCGASWEGYVIEERLKAVEPDEAFFWATHQGAEIDLVLIKAGHTLGVECKRIDAPSLTPSMRIALGDLRLERIAVVYPGVKRYPVSEQVEAVPLEALVHGREGVFPT